MIKLVEKNYVITIKCSSKVQLLEMTFLKYIRLTALALRKIFPLITLEIIIVKLQYELL